MGLIHYLGWLLARIRYWIIQCLDGKVEMQITLSLPGVDVCFFERMEVVRLVVYCVMNCALMLMSAGWKRSKFWGNFTKNLVFIIIELRSAYLAFRMNEWVVDNRLRISGWRYECMWIVLFKSASNIPREIWMKSFGGYFPPSDTPIDCRMYTKYLPAILEKYMCRE